MSDGRLMRGASGPPVKKRKVRVKKASVSNMAASDGEGDDSDVAAYANSDLGRAEILSRGSMTSRVAGLG